ncbi:HpcH/HpaI aldolase/citrate lyase family protein [Corynebacterium argentoratense]|uniref:HpcH/HpaI aldolase/citrate lyase family protein n=1 Tax=Corynebacterium argentoratense TaxID=42817 RepID=UPI001F20C5D1|nr:CoA ester lyase [Corynebacterium argentoratense]MCF1694532.1 CoA ester lyase [Corynebacterium argentoratense]MCF1736104.1 CoA ester lyase [Corynebacterium argentoratense]
MVINDSYICGPAVLFAPANRPEIFPKAAAAADMVILDLEDGAGEAPKQQCRRNIIDSTLDPARTIVRVTGPDHPDFIDDVACAKASPYDLIMVPKVRASLPEEVQGLKVIAMVETPQAVVGIDRLASDPSVVGMFWGAEDLTMELGGTHSRFLVDEGAPSGRPGPYRDTMRLARATMHLHASAWGKFTIDAVHADFNDEAGMFAEAVDAARSGFAASACIHPRQVATVRKAYQPDPGQLEWARRVVDEAASFPGAFKLDGQMIDAPLIAQARRILNRGGQAN